MVRTMKRKMIAVCCAILLLSAMPGFATRTAVVPAYAYVSMEKSSIRAYQDFLNEQNRAAAKKLVHAEKVFQSPKDMKVEIVKIDQNIAKVKMSRLDSNAKPVTFFFWTIIDQLKMLP